MEKQVFSWCDPKKKYIWCIITFRSRLSHDAPKTLIFDAFLRGKAGFLMMRPKKECTFDALLRFIITFRGSFSLDAPKTLIFDAFLCVKADFLMTRQKGAHLLHYDATEKRVYIWCIITFHYYVSWQFFSWRAKNSYIWCIFMWKSRFSHKAPITLIFGALILGKAGFLMKRPKTKCTFDALLHFFSWPSKLFDR